MITADKLRLLFNPRTVALVGATSNVSSVGYALVRNMIGASFDGIVYPVNAKRDSVMGIRAYPAVSAIPDKVDLVVVATPARSIPAIVEDSGKAGVKAMVIISAGFLESGEEGNALFAEVLRVARQYGIRFIGPNCLGIMRPSLGLNASFANKIALPGRIAFISQSGALCTSVLDWSVKQKVGFSYFISIGSQGDVDFGELIDYLGMDSGVSSILIYMESLKNAKRFMSAARSFSRTMPIVVLKVGRSSAGADAARSHTGSLSGDDATYDAAFRRVGILRVKTIGELFNTAQLLAMQPRPCGNRLAIVTNAGGPGVIATDTLCELGGELARLSDTTMAALDKALPAAWSHGNPVDVLGDAPPERYKEAVELCLADENTDGLLVLLTPQAMTDPTAVARLVAGVRNAAGKTVMASWMGADDVVGGSELLQRSGIPVFELPEEAVGSFMVAWRYSRNMELLSQTPPNIPNRFNPNTAAADELVERARAEGRTVLTEHEAKSFLAAYEIPVPRFRVVRSADAARTAAAEIGLPVAMKISSQDILHKTDVGGVKIGVATADAAAQAYDEIMASATAHKPEARIEGVLVEQMVSRKYELFIGSKKDPIFGPVIVFGLGGVSVEVYKDVNTGLPPLNMFLAQRLIEDTRIYTLLKGYRGMKGVKLQSLQFLLYRFAYLIMDFPQIREIDINPFGIDDTGGVVMDAKIILDPRVPERGKVKPYSHLVISPYPRGFERKVTLKDGREILLRPIRPEDEPLEEAMFRAFSARTQRFRFFQQISQITHEMLIRYTQIDYDREMAIIAVIDEPDGQKMAGVVRIIGDPYNDSAEFAIVVADPWQGLGLGHIFTDYILEVARMMGFRRIYANFMLDNVIMRHLFELRNFTITRGEDMYTGELVLS